MKIFKKLFSQLKNWRKHNNPPLDHYYGGNMYDLFTKKKMDIPPTNKKDTYKYDNGRINYNSTYEGPKVKRFVIPVGGITKEQAEEQVRKMMESYHETVEWWGDGGLDTFQSQPREYKRIISDLDPYGEENWEDDDIDMKIPTNKDFWFPTEKERESIDKYIIDKRSWMDEYSNYHFISE